MSRGGSSVGKSRFNPQCGTVITIIVTTQCLHARGLDLHGAVSMHPTPAWSGVLCTDVASSLHCPTGAGTRRQQPFMRGEWP